MQMVTGIGFGRGPTVTRSMGHGRAVGRGTKPGLGGVPAVVHKNVPINCRMRNLRSLLSLGSVMSIIRDNGGCDRKQNVMRSGVGRGRADNGSLFITRYAGCEKLAWI
ncbi:hypothetical protein GWI33_017088 [Rhynchophorus ferrugineus]|uniref:Uncharacterized protein n=1 Tax=Rhynchophorus ferrugineus TaxID=354439 RepID=A0A834HZI4_RHYFE|nr:hypothetical protein GWI33_017088 [Rhynchophorus ferrugineus]